MWGEGGGVAIAVEWGHGFDRELFSNGEEGAEYGGLAAVFRNGEGRSSVSIPFFSFSFWGGGIWS